METYILLGTYENDDRNNVEVIATSNNLANLNHIKNAINQINGKMLEKDYPTKEINNIINLYLLEIDLIDEVTGCINEINVLGIFEINEIDKQIIINCNTCKKNLFKGSENEAKGQIIYCTDCA